MPSTVEARKSLVDRNCRSFWNLAQARTSRLARASWIEIRISERAAIVASSRGSQEPRGSKYPILHQSTCGSLSRLARASWIEMLTRVFGLTCGVRRGSQEPRGSKSSCIHYLAYTISSRLARASWIEMFHSSIILASAFVEARKSLVDRNHIVGVYVMPYEGRGSQEPRGSK